MNSKSEFYIDDLLHEQENKFCTYSNATIYATTFNVNGRSPPEYLGNWLVFDTTNLPDLIIIGLQEMDLNLGTYVTDNALKQHEWLFNLQRALPNVYERVDCIRLIGIFLVLYRSTKSKFKISNVQTAMVPTGFLKFGNKGGVGISLELNDTELCIINSHLAAGNGELARRNQDFRDISQMQFTNFKGIYDHDVVIWIGDLNYRLTSPLQFEEVVHMCVTGQHDKLFQYDQLREQQREGAAFYGFKELVPPFKPTYKYDVGTSNWDSSEKRRAPAWCDRVLYWVRDKNVKIEQTHYRSSDSVVFSDHKPVSSSFKLCIKKVDRTKRLAVYDALLKENDRKANNLLPQISLSQTEVDFGSIEFDNAAIAKLKIKNTGSTSTRFHFSNQHQELKGTCINENWLSVTPKSSFIEIGGEVLVTLQACVNNKEAQEIKEPVAITSILILSLDQGRDYFIVVTAKLIASNQVGQSGPPLVTNPGEDNEKWLIDFDDKKPGASAR